MFDPQRMFQDRGIIDIINIIAANRKSGSLEVGSGTTLGSLLFHQGQLVDARLGDLKGFPAVNALASLRDARFNFDPSVTPPSVSSITATERAVLKQFFGIETAEVAPLPDSTEVTLLRDPHAEVAAEMSDIPDSQSEYDEAAIATSEIPDAEREYGEAAIAMSEIPDADREYDEAAIAMSAIPNAERDLAFVPQPSSKPYIIGGLVLALLCGLVAVAAITMRKEYARVSSSQVETTPEVENTPASPMEPSPTPTTAVQELVATAPAPVTGTSDYPTETVNNESKRPDSPTSVAADLTGRWTIINTVRQTSYKPFGNLKVGFDLSINQAGDSFTGKGKKVSENGQALPASSRTPIEVKGSIKGDRVEATFFETGAQRKTNGRFIWRIDRESGALTGSFVSTAARTRGISSAKKS